MSFIGKKLFRAATPSPMAFAASLSSTASAASVPAAAFLPKAVVTARVIEVVKSVRSAPRTVEVGDHFVATYGFDSLIRKDLVAKLEAEFCVTVPSKDSDSLLSVTETVAYFAGHPKAR